MNVLASNGIKITIETNGSIIPDSGIAYYVMDYKLPSSGVHDQMLDVKYFRWLNHDDIIKFVVANREDFDYAVTKLKEISDVGHFVSLPLIAFSPILIKLSPQTLIDWIETEGLNRRYRIVLNVQLHKLLKLRPRTERGEV
jgi:7-carboxy-7-deazaguanine synthase